MSLTGFYWIYTGNIGKDCCWSSILGPSIRLVPCVGFGLHANAGSRFHIFILLFATRCSWRIFTVGGVWWTPSSSRLSPSIARHPEISVRVFVNQEDSPVCIKVTRSIAFKIIGDEMQPKTRLMLVKSGWRFHRTEGKEHISLEKTNLCSSLTV